MVSSPTPDRMRTTAGRGAALVWFATLALSLAVASTLHAQAAGPVQRDESIFVKEQQSFTPGYAVGDIAIGDPTVADFRVLPGRRELLLLGRGRGTTTLVIWDQRKVKRHEVLITVQTREAVQQERDLREMLAKWPDVQVRTLGSGLVLSGTVDSPADLQQVTRIAGAAGVESLVTLTPSATPPPPTSPMPTPTGTVGGGGAGGSVSGSALRVQYEVELFEASIAYRSGSYATGVEPSGRSLFKANITAAVGAEQDIYIPGSAARGKDTNSKTAGTTGLRLKVRPGAIAPTGEFSTYILVETNLPPGGGPYDPAVMRRARWEFSGLSGEPLGLAGNELLATAVVAERGSKLGRIVGTITGLGGIIGSPGTEYGAAVPYFDKGKNTQLLVVLRPQVAGPAK